MIREVDYTMNGEEIFNKVIDCIMDAIEEFFSVLTIPTLRVTRDALVVSFLFLAFSVVTSVFKIPAFISWQESLTATVILTGIVLIDSATRKSIRENLMKLRDTAVTKLAQSEQQSDDEMEEGYGEPREQ